MSTLCKLVLADVCAWPNLFRIRADLIGAVIFNRPSHGLEEGSLELWCCNNTGLDWSYLSTPCPNLSGENRMHCGCGVMDNGDIHVLSTGFSVADGKFIKLEPLWHSLSSDRGKTWKIHKNMDIDGLDVNPIPHGSIVNSNDGNLLATVYRSFGKGKASKTWVIQSRDEGASWSCHSQIGNGDTNEAFLAIAAVERIAAVRTHVDHHTRLFKSSPATRWKDCGPLTLPMQHPGHLVVLGKQSLLLTYGIRNKGLMALAGRFSDTLGDSWGAPFIIHQFPATATDCGYPSTIILNDEELLTGFYTNASPEYDGYQFGVIRWNLSTFLSPKELDSISDGKKMII